MPTLHNSTKTPTTTHQSTHWITSTVYSTSSQVTTTQTAHSKLPVGAIVGGTAGGAFLALVIAFLWVLCRKAMRIARDRQEQDKAAVGLTRRNTTQNAYKVTKPELPAPKAPLFWTRTTTKVKFVGFEGDSEKSAPILSRPMPLRAAKAFKDAESILRPPPLIHKPSNISSASCYSTESGEERRRLTTMQMLLNALGSLGSSSGDVGRMSWGTGSRTSIWTMLSGGSRSGPRLSQATSASIPSRQSRVGGGTRFSQATSGSMYSQTDDELSRPPIGIAH